MEGGCRRLHSSPNTIRVIKLRMTRWVGHVVRIGEVKKAYNTLIVNPE